MEQVSDGGLVGSPKGKAQGILKWAVFVYREKKYV